MNMKEIKQWIDKIMMKLGYITYKEHTKKYEELTKEYKKLIANKDREIRQLEDPRKRPLYIRERRIGNSTRLVDYYIQMLFMYTEIKVIDHHNTIEASKFLFKTITRRLEIEHPWIRNSIKIDRNRLTITLMSEQD